MIFMMVGGVEMAGIGWDFLNFKWFYRVFRVWNLHLIIQFCRFEELGVEFVKKPTDGKMKGLAFIKDPDGYWIEILSANNMKGAF